MASILSHGIAAAALAEMYSRGEALPPAFWAVTVACSIIPDLDVIGFALGVQYGDFLGHRGFTHSLSFALMVALASAALLRRAGVPRSLLSLTIFLFVVTASHGVLDAFTDGGLGVAFFSPFKLTRYFFPWRPILVSPIGVVPFLSYRGLRVLLNEIVWIWLPSAALAALSWWRSLRLRHGP